MIATTLELVRAIPLFAVFEYFVTHHKWPVRYIPNKYSWDKHQTDRALGE